ncbi:MAG: phenylalanine--tRNA ligase subunit beta [Patescibacteria group bacterium]
MKVSLNWAQFYSNVDLKSIGKDELLKRIGAQLGAVEDVVEWGPRYDGIVVAKVISCEKHQAADKLSVCRIDDGGAVQDVERGDDGLVQVVCGAPKVAEGMTVAWIPPGTVVPSTIDKDPFTLEVREIRGAKSNGMLASASELGISDNHDGILEIKESDVLTPDLMTLGTPFKQLYGLDDVVFDLENKMFTHRPDCFGILGVARELAGICGLQFKSPDWYTQPITIESTSQLPFSSRNEIPELVPRFMAQVVEGIQITQSPTWMLASFTRTGLKPINNIVDRSNYYMQLTAQPTHAFDYDKVKALCGEQVTIFPRLANDGEEIKLLGGKTIKLTNEDIVIATDKQAIALAGVMGGAETEVDENTKNIIIECATFDMYAIRRTSMRHGLFTDAVTRFNKGQSPLQNHVVLAKLVSNMVKHAEGKAGEVYDSNPDIKPMPVVSVSTEFINQRLGSSLTTDEIAEMLRRVEFEVGPELEVSPPFWRRDIEFPEDIVEEIGRLYGYDKLPVALPPRGSKPAIKYELLENKKRLRKLLAAAGANEVLTYSFVHENLMQKVGQNKENAYHVRNAISPDLQYYRMSLMPSLLDKVNMNIRAGYEEFALFEMNKVHNKDLTEDDLPIEENRLALVIAVDDKAAKAKAGAAFYQARLYLECVAQAFGVELIYEPATTHEPKMEIGKAAVAPFEPRRSAYVKTVDGELIAELGEFKSTTRQNLKLPSYTAGFELDIDRLIAHAKNPVYTPLPRFPKVEQDISLRVNNDVAFADLQSCVEQAVIDLQPDHSITYVNPLDIYQKAGEPDKQIAFRMSIANYQRTLTSEEVNTLLDKAAEAAKQQFGAERI